MGYDQIVAAIVAGASAHGPQAVRTIGDIAGAEVVKELTKEAYRRVTSALISVRGRGIGRTIEEVETDPSSKTAQSKLARQIHDIDEDDLPEISEKCASLLDALRDDNAAIHVARVIGRIDIRVKANGDVRIEDVRGADEFTVDADAGEDFHFRGVEMNGDKNSGK